MNSLCDTLSNKLCRRFKARKHVFGCLSRSLGILLDGVGDALELGVVERDAAEEPGVQKILELLGQFGQAEHVGNMRTAFANG